MSASKLKETPLVRFVLQRVNKICAFSYVVGVLWFLALSHHDIGASEYHSENALLTGLQQLHFGQNQVHEASKYNKIVLESRKVESPSTMQGELAQLMLESGIYAYTQKFASKSPLPNTAGENPVYKTYNGTNVYGIIRAGRASSTESIVLNVPIGNEYHNYAIGIVLALGSQIRDQLYWAKDIILLFSEHGYVGAQAWLQSYYDTKTSDFIKSAPLEERAGLLLGALVIDMPERVSYVSAEVVGNNGQLPNLDIFRVFTKLSRMEYIPVAINGENQRHHPLSIDGYLQSLRTTVRMMSKQARGFSQGNHATFLQYNVQSLSLEGVENKKMRSVDTEAIGKVIEGIVRSLNNLLEILHHSFFFYLISSTERFISVGLYSPPLGLIILAPTLKALYLWIEMVDDDEKEEDDKKEKDMDPENKSFEELISEIVSQTPAKVEDSAWIGVFYILALMHLLGVGLYFSPKFAVTWSAMFGLTPRNSLLAIYLSTYLIGLAVPFTSLFRFPRNAEVLDLLRIISLVLYAGILGCVAVINFSLGMLLSLASVPLITPIYAGIGRIQMVRIVFSLLASPISIALILTAAEGLFFGKSVYLWSSAESILESIYEQSLLGNNWIFQFTCLLLYPNWLLFWLQSTAKVAE